MIATFLIVFFISLFTGEGKPKKLNSKKKKRQRHETPLTRKQRIRQQIRERMLQIKAATIEVCVHLFVCDACVRAF